MLQLFWGLALTCLPLAAAAHLFNGSPDPLPSWVPIAGLIIAGVMGGTVGFAITKHRQSMERQKQQRLQRAAAAGASAVMDSSGTDSTGVTSPPPESAP
jgi:hypothetical protein